MQQFDDRRCGACGYDLNGLPARGVCPECGNLFDAGTGRGLESNFSQSVRRGDRLVYRFKVWGSLALATTIMGLGVILSRYSAMPARPIAIAALLAGLLCLAALTTWFVQRDEGR